MPGSTRDVRQSAEDDGEQAQTSSSSSSGSSSKAGSVNGQAKASSDAQHDRSSETDGDDDEEYDEEDDDDQEDEEPALRYSRLSTYSQAVQDLLNRDTCSSIAVSSKYIVLATHSGGVCVLSRTKSSEKDKGKGKAKPASELESTGASNEAEGYTVLRRYKPHTAAVTDIVIDEDSQFIGTASMDGEWQRYKKVRG
jgi:hypothetical protein